MQEFIVSTLEDENDGDFGAEDLSLREAIAQANEQEGEDTITFDSSLSGGTINLSLGELVVDQNIAIEGLGADQLTIDAGGNSRVFNLDDGNAETKIDVVIDGLNITGGNASSEELGTFGGGIFNQENLELNNSEISDNTAFSGGGIYNLDATANINNSAIANNSADVNSRGGGIANLRSTVQINSSLIDSNSSTAIDAEESEINIVDSNVVNNGGIGTGGIRAASTSTINLENSQVNNNSASVLGISGGITSVQDSILNINNSTISENSGEGPGEGDPKGRRTGAAGISASGTTNISNSTISNNRGFDVGFGIVNVGRLDIANSTVSGNENTGISGGTVALSSTIVANNGEVGTPDISVGELSGNNNLIGNGDGVAGLSDSNLIGTADNPIDPQLGELQDNGGSTLTQALQEGSPAIDTGSNPNNLETDQRGSGFDRTVGENTDIGAFEVQADDGGGQTPSDLVVSILEDENDGDFSAGDLSLREAIALANEQEGEDTITFDESLSGETITLVQDQSSGRPTLINAPLSITDSVTIDGLGANNITIDGDNGGSGIFNLGGEDENIDVTVDGVTLANGGQSAFFFPGLSAPGGSFFIAENANLTLQDSVITGSGASVGGAIANYGKTSIIGSTITDSTSGSDAPASRPLFSNGVIANRGEIDVIDSNISNNNGGALTNAGTLEVNK